jgi:hypothetical protein
MNPLVHHAASPYHPNLIRAHKGSHRYTVVSRYLGREEKYGFSSAPASVYGIRYTVHEGGGTYYSPHSLSRD